jgi:hypothetical protein
MVCKDWWALEPAQIPTRSNSCNQIGIELVSWSSSPPVTVPTILPGLVNKKNNITKKNDALAAVFYNQQVFWDVMLLLGEGFPTFLGIIFSWHYNTL